MMPTKGSVERCDESNVLNYFNVRYFLKSFFMINMSIHSNKSHHTNRSPRLASASGALLWGTSTGLDYPTLRRCRAIQVGLGICYRFEVIVSLSDFIVIDNVCVSRWPQRINPLDERSLLDKSFKAASPGLLKMYSLLTLSLDYFKATLRFLKHLEIQSCFCALRNR